MLTHGGSVASTRVSTRHAGVRAPRGFPDEPVSSTGSYFKDQQIHRSAPTGFTRALLITQRGLGCIVLTSVDEVAMDAHAPVGWTPNQCANLSIAG
jgi:hypothetical protein